MASHRVVVMVFLGSMSIPGLVWADGEPLRERRMQEVRFEPSVLQYSTAPFARLDSDGDGRISVIEAGNRPLPEAFWILDRNQDGHLSPKELRQLPN